MWHCTRNSTPSSWRTEKRKGDRVERGDVRWFTAFDGKKIAVYIWDRVESPVGIVQIAHGMMEHAHRYNRFARFLNGQGFIVAAGDHRGHGVTAALDDSQGWAGEDGFNRTVKDMAMLAGQMKKRYPGLPLVLLGHSYGSFLSQAFIEHDGEMLDGLILSGSARNRNPALPFAAVMAKAEMLLKGPRYPSRRMGGLFFGGNNRRIEDPESGFSWLSRDVEEVEAYRSDPWCGTAFSCSFYHDFLKGLVRLNRKSSLGEIPSDLPILIVSGEADPVGGYGKYVEKLYERYAGLGVRDVSLKLYPHGRHEMLHEINKEKVYGDIIAWIRRILWNEDGNA